MSTLSATNRHEPGYKAVLIREEAKRSFREFRAGIGSHSGVVQERHCATAAIELVIEDPLLMGRFMAKVSAVIQREMADIQAVA